MRNRLAEFGAGFLRLALLPIGPSLEAGHPATITAAAIKRIDAVSVPQLFVAVLADGLVHLAKKSRSLIGGELIYRDDTDRFWKQTPARSSPPPYSEGVMLAQGTLTVCASR